MGIGKVVMTHSLVSMATVPASVFVYRKVAFSYGRASWCHEFAIYRKERRVWHGAMNGYYRECKEMYLETSS